MGGAVTYDRPLQPAVMLRRYKRFLADVRLPDGSEATAWCPSPGRMTGCWAPGEPCRVSTSDNPARKRKLTLEQTSFGGVWVTAHAGRTNAVVAEALAARRVAELADFDEIVPERRVDAGTSRLDFLLTGRGRTWVEVKTVTLIEDRRALFPDAVTARGARHLDALATAARAGDRAVLLWVVGRADGDSVGPADHIDPAYGTGLRDAIAAGVEILGYRLELDEVGMVLGGPVPVRVEPVP